MTSSILKIVKESSSKWFDNEISVHEFFQNILKESKIGSISFYWFFKNFPNVFRMGSDDDRFVIWLINQFLLIIYLQIQKSYTSKKIPQNWSFRNEYSKECPWATNRRSRNLEAWVEDGVFLVSWNSLPCFWRRCFLSVLLGFQVVFWTRSG